MKDIIIIKDVLTKDIADKIMRSRDAIDDLGVLKIDKSTNAYIYEYFEKNVLDIISKELGDLKYVDLEWIKQGSSSDTSVDGLHFDINSEMHDGKLYIASHVCLIYLNNSDEDFFGGQLHFPFQNIVVEPKVGTLVIFPTGHHYPHKVLPFLGSRYLLKVFNLYDSKLSSQDRVEYNSQMNVTFS